MVSTQATLTTILLYCAAARLKRHTPPRSSKPYYLSVSGYVYVIGRINVHALTVRTDMPPESDPYWTSEQLKWMEDQVAMYSWCYEDNDLLLFWPLLFEVFFACWPQRQALLADIPESQVLTDEQHHTLSKAEDYCKMRIKTWLEYKRTLSSAWIPYVPFPMGSPDVRQAVLQLELALNEVAWTGSSTLNSGLPRPYIINNAGTPMGIKRADALASRTFSSISGYPEHAVLFPGISENLLSPEQAAAVEVAKEACKVPLVEAEAEAGNVASSGKHVALGQKFSKELLDDESDNVKAEIRAKYEERLKAHKNTKRRTHALDDDDSDNGETDAEFITQGIDDLPVICRRFAQLVKHKTQFLVSFMFAGPDPRNNWDMTTLSCHPLETPEGKSFPVLYETADRAFLEAFQQYAEQIFPANKRKPSAGDNSESKMAEESDEGEPEGENKKLVEEDFQGEMAGMGMGNSGNASPMTGTVVLSIPGALDPLVDASVAPGLHHANDTHHGNGMQTTMHGTQTELPYSMQAPPAYDTQATYGTQAHLAYNSDSRAQYHAHAHATASLSHASFQTALPHTNASFQQGLSLPMQMGNYPGFSVEPSNSFSQADITPNFSFAEGFQVPNWNFFDTGFPAPQGRWPLSLGLLSPTSAERSSTAEINDDSLPIMPSPVPAKTIGASLPMLPSPVDSLPVPLPTAPSLAPALETSRPPSTKASMEPKPAKKCSNANRHNYGVCIRCTYY
ncbi:uncharacterized protein F5147DRAFT_655770 [Suillus discolor]|uniref:Uncharacterized protein n=1 Tax=Suillus discolor TaxID=1912936 RepID=A0A9P7EZB1_9AGAM|nr:uncharacterized protein F5147DRAFT_655770 [Suillus discolor]KAG2099573.1 hypothetical protein F5147DRAFT_655770 [Suillus discolor]